MHAHHMVAQRGAHGGGFGIGQRKVTFHILTNGIKARVKLLTFRQRITALRKRPSDASVPARHLLPD